ncbi:MAG: nuclear transport factor 2 family protein [Arenimonas sp.]
MEPANTALIRTLYAAFARRDGAGMAACYAPDAHFSDPVFTDLNGAEVGAMWTMLCARAEGLQIRLTDAGSSGDEGHARWEADYPFSQTGRIVHNRIDARFKFRDGKIVEHIDTFDLWKWAAMALGAKGTLLGWLPAVQGKIRAQADKGLREFIARNQR